MGPGFKRVPTVAGCFAILELLAQSEKNQFLFKPAVQRTKGKKLRVGTGAPPGMAVFFLTGTL